MEEGGRQGELSFPALLVYCRPPRKEEDSWQLYFGYFTTHKMEEVLLPPVAAHRTTQLRLLTTQQRAAMTVALYL